MYYLSSTELSLKIVSLFDKAYYCCVKSAFSYTFHLVFPDSPSSLKLNGHVKGVYRKHISLHMFRIC